MNAHANFAPARITPERIDAQIAAARKRLTYAEAAMIVAAQRGPRPVVFVPSTYSYPSVSNEVLRDQMAAMFAVADERTAWDRAVDALLSRPLTAS